MVLFNPLLRDKGVNTFPNGIMWGSPGGIEANVQDYDIVKTEFEFKLRYPISFWTNGLGKTKNSFIPYILG